MFKFKDGEREFVISVKPRFYFLSMLTLITLPYCLYRAYKDNTLKYVANLVIVLWIMSYIVYLFKNVDIPQFWISGSWVIMAIYILLKFIFSIPKMKLQNALQNYEMVLDEKVDQELIDYLETYKKPKFIFKVNELKKGKDYE